MLFRVVRPMKRSGSRFAYFVQRIPANIRDKVTGERLAIPLGDGVTRSECRLEGEGRDSRPQYVADPCWPITTAQ